jgi:hypothetical protein
LSDGRVLPRRVSERVGVWAWRGGWGLLVALSAFGFANAFVFKIHGPGRDLGVIAGLLALCVFGMARGLGRRR